MTEKKQISYRLRNKQIKGRITGSDDNDALSGAVIYVVNTRSAGVTADIDGNYVLNIGEAKSVQLRVSYLGHETQTVTVKEGQDIYNVSLKQEQNVLDEIVFTAAGRPVLRGNRSITGENQALVVLDGAVVENSILDNINPQDIQDIQVLNGAAGATLCGSEASNGVLIITTKRGSKGGRYASGLLESARRHIQNRECKHQPVCYRSGL